MLFSHCCPVFLSIKEGTIELCAVLVIAVILNVVNGIVNGYLLEVVEKETEGEAALDPLGALRATNDEHVNEQHKKELMSPSRARFIREHSASPFAHEVIFFGVVNAVVRQWRYVVVWTVVTK